MDGTTRALLRRNRFEEIWLDAFHNRHAREESSSSKQETPGRVEDLVGCLGR
jgi:hypothetical protein